ncbi:MAG: TldD/PmbA family protein [Ruminococcaceae bacterium]|nr:TldD/PmbA family protein [Oscillospiraceae bacterium]
MNFEVMKQALVAAAERAGIEQYEIYCETDETLSVETLKDTISSFSSGMSGGICFRCVVNGKMGYASGELMTVEAMEDLVSRAVSNAKCIDSEDVAIIYGGSEKYGRVELPTPQMTDAATLRRTALELQKRTYAENEAVSDGTQSYMMSTVNEVRLCNSNGLDLSNRVGTTAGYVSAVVRVGEEAQEAYEMGVGATADELATLPAAAVKKALDKMGAVTVESGKYNVVFAGEQFRNFLSTFSDVFSAKQAQLGLSLLAGKEGEVVAADCVTVTDDPMRADYPMQAPFDGEGVATYRKNVIENGVLRTLLYDLTTAHKAGKASTGNGQKHGYSSSVSIAPYSFFLHAGDKTTEELLALAGDGIYVTECKGFHAGANSVTGDFSIESAGFRIRNGRVAEPIKSFTVAGNFFELLKEINALGDTVRWSALGGFTTFGAPDLLVKGMSVAGK